jgi:hypothetical protein
MYKVALHRISTGESLIVGEYSTLAIAKMVRADFETRLLEWDTLVVYILPVDANG